MDRRGELGVAAHQGRKLRLLGSAGSQRYPTLPDVPTIAESGVPSYSHAVWAAVTMPAKVPPAVVAKVNADIATVVNAPEVKARLATLGIEVATSTPQELAQLIRDDYARWGRIIRATRIKVD
jgi:tripartite-type tricarboxylate transporter receptor subunit TctC